MSGQRAMLVVVELTAADVERVPAENLRVPRAEFAAVWRAAEQPSSERPADWYAGVVMTCEWLARATVRPASGQRYVARSPVTERLAYAMPETIEAEYSAVAKLAMRQPRPTWLVNRSGWIEGVEATFDWAWRGAAGPPVNMPQRAAG